MAPPMPPVAPVTRALRPVRSNMRGSSYPFRDALKAATSSGVPMATAEAPGGDALHEAGQHLAGADLIERIDALGRHVGHALAPAHGAGDLADQGVADRGRIGDGSGLHIGHDRHGRGIHGHACQRLAHGVGRRLHQGAMEGGGHGQHHGALGALGPGRWRPPARRRPCGRRPRPGRRHCRWPHRRPRPEPPRGRPRGRRRIRARAAPPWRPAPPERRSAWRCRGSAEAGPYRQIDRLPAAASAEYSPSEWPATKAACCFRSSPASASSTRIAARLTAIRAGWVLAVRVSSSAGPSHMRAESFWDRASSTSSNTALACGKASARALPMPTAWLPWPGKMNARFIRNGSLDSSNSRGTRTGGRGVKAKSALLRT